MTANLLGLDQSLGVRVRDVSLEVSVPDHLRELRAGLRVTEKSFREEHDKLEMVSC